MTFRKCVKFLAVAFRTPLRCLDYWRFKYKSHGLRKRWTSLIELWKTRNEDFEIKTAPMKGSASAQKKVKFRVKKAALLVAYVGDRYHGSQRNGSLATVDLEILKALKSSGVVCGFELSSPGKIRFCGASRTDKGVSSCGQVVSVLLPLCEDVVDRINSQLPEDILVLGIVRATKGFHAKFCADGRTYSYTTPTYAFANAEDVCRSYRISSDKLRHIDSIAYRYKGAHKFHNFTNDVEMSEMRGVRFIVEFYRSDPFQEEGMEFVKFTIKGQSFMRHQIRKMIGLLMVIVSNRASEELYVRAFSEPSESIPTAPGTGLVLEEVHYNGYNQKHGRLYGGIRFPNAKDAQKEFLDQRIFRHIVRKEVENNYTMTWLETLPLTPT